MDTEMDIAKAIQCGTILRVLNHKISTSPSSSLSSAALSAAAAATLMVKMEIEMEMDQNCAEQRVKHLKRSKQCADNRQQHYSHAHH